MKTVESLRTEIKKLCLQAVLIKINLLDLSEKLPANWERVPEVAEAAFVIHQKLAEAHRKLMALGG
jgi:hypothetical protein